jgi:hypothetical protein
MKERKVVLTLAEEETGTLRVRVLVRLDVERSSDSRGTTEQLEHM